MNLESKATATTMPESDMPMQHQASQNAVDYVTVIRSQNPSTLCKEYVRNADGSISKEAVAHVSRGIAVRHHVPDATAFRTLLASVTASTDQALMLGTFEGAGDEPVNVVTSDSMRDRLGLPKDAPAPHGLHRINGKLYAARLAKGIKPSRWLLLDADCPEGCPASWQGTSVADRLNALSTIIPGINTAERIELLSSSARVKPDSVTSHAYVQMADVNDLERFRAVVLARSIMATCDGTVRRIDTAYRHPSGGWRALLDLAVWHNGRLVFCAQPNVDRAPGLAVTDAKIRLVNPEGGALDTSQTKSLDTTAEATIRANVSGGFRIIESRGSYTIDDGTTLRGDMQIEARGVSKSLQEWIRSIPINGKLRCEAPFRQSQSEAAALFRHERLVVLVDIGAGRRWTVPVKPDGTVLDWIAQLPSIDSALEHVQRTDDTRPTMTAKGLCVFVDVNAKEKNASPSYVASIVCRPLRVSRKSRDIDGQRWATIVEFFSQDHVLTELALPDAHLSGKSDEVAQMLAAAGFGSIPSKRNRDVLMSWLSRQNPQSRERVIAHAGWCGDRFLLPDGTVLGAPSTDGEAISLLDAQTNLGVRGSAADWANSVGMYLTPNPLLALCAGVGFSGPVAALVNRPAPGLNIVGKTSTGKSCALLVTASIWADPVQFKMSWSATASGLEGHAALRNHLVMALDEVGAATKSGIESVYSLADGQGKARANRDGSAKNSARWACAFLSTGEVTLPERMAELKIKVHTGMTIRFIDCEATGKYGLFSNLTGHDTPAAMARQVEAAAKKAYGAAGRAFVEWIMRDKDTVAERVSDILDDVALNPDKYGGNASMAPHNGRALERFILAGVSIGLAGEAGLVPSMTMEHGLKYAGAAFRRWLGADNGQAVETRQGVDTLIKLLLQYANTDRFIVLDDGTSFHHRPDLDVQARTGAPVLGWKQTSNAPDGSTLHYLLMTREQMAMAAGVTVAGVRQVADELLRRGLLMAGDRAETRTQRKRIGGAQVSVYVLKNPTLMPDIEGVK